MNRRQRVGSSPGAAITMTLFWLVPNSIPTAFAIYVVVEAFRGAFVDTGTAVFSVVLTWVPAALLWWVWWRHVGRACSPRGNGLRVRGFFRTNGVSWQHVVDVESKEYWQGALFKWTLVTFQRPDRVRTTTVKVGARADSGSVHEFTILTWLPQTHSLRNRLPQGHTGATKLPDMSRETRSGIKTLPVLDRLRPQRSLRIFRLVLLTTFFSLPLAAGAAACARYAFYQSDEIGFLVGFCLLAGLSAATVWVGVRIWRARVELTTGGLISRGSLGTQVYPVDVILFFRAAPGGWFRKVLVVELAAYGTYALAVGGWSDSDSEEVAQHLEQWRMGTTQVGADGFLGTAGAPPES